LLPYDTVIKITAECFFVKDSSLIRMTDERVLPVLTATSRFYGKAKNLTPTESKPLQRIVLTHSRVSQRISRHLHGSSSKYVYADLSSEKKIPNFARLIC